MKLVIEEPESIPLEGYLPRDALLATSRIALVEVPRATALANPGEEVRTEAARLLQACALVAVGDRVLRQAAAITSREVRTLDAIHIASALLFQERTGTTVVFATHDAQQATGARALGFELIGV